jgi:hypothetical protein
MIEDSECIYSFMRSVRRALVTILGIVKRVGTKVEARLRVWREERHFKPIIQRERAELLKARQQYAHLYAGPEQYPLVSVVIPTWNRGQLLVERTLPSVFNQTYQNFEIVIVGDHCTDDTEERINQLNDPRIRFYNLPERGNYPKDPRARWRVAGTQPFNRARGLVQGKWIAQLDDDELFAPDHIEVLLRYAQAHDLEIVFGKLRIERTPGKWTEGGKSFSYPGGSPSSPGRASPLATAILRSYIFKTFPGDINAWRIGWSGDQHLFWRMYRTGVRDGFVDQVVTIAPLRPGQTRGGHRAKDRG